MTSRATFRLVVRYPSPNATTSREAVARDRRSRSRNWTADLRIGNVGGSSPASVRFGTEGRRGGRRKGIAGLEVRPYNPRPFNAGFDSRRPR